MSDSSLGVDAPTPRRSRLDSSLNIILIVALVAALAIAGIFGYTVWRDRQERRSATPALRTIGELEAQTRKAPNNVVLHVRLGEAYGAAGMTAKADQAAADSHEARQEARGSVARPRHDRDEREEVPRGKGVLHQGRGPHDGRRASRTSTLPGRTPSTVSASSASRRSSTRMRSVVSRRRCASATTPRTPTTTSPWLIGDSVRTMPRSISCSSRSPSIPRTALRTTCSARSTSRARTS